MGKLFLIINIYGPYGNKQVFSDNFKMMDMVKKYNVILGRDLNLIMKTREIWGEGIIHDHQINSFIHLFKDLSLCDVEPTQLVLTWRNLRRGRINVLQLDSF